MGSHKDKSMPAAELRRRAEDRLNKQAKEARTPQIEHETEWILHELQVHQIELVMLKEELQQAKDRPSTSLFQRTEFQPELDVSEL